MTPSGHSPTVAAGHALVLRASGPPHPRWDLRSSGPGLDRRGVVEPGAIPSRGMRDASGPDRRALLLPPDPGPCGAGRPPIWELTSHASHTRSRHGKPPVWTVTEPVARRVYARSLLRVTTSSAWQAASVEERRALVVAAGYEARVITERLIRVSARLHAEWTRALARGLPVPSWWHR